MRQRDFMKVIAGLTAVAVHSRNRDSAFGAAQDQCERPARKPVSKSGLRHILSIVGLLGGTAANFDYAFAVNMDEAAAQCREQLSPTVRACVRKNMVEKGGSPDQYIPGCKFLVAPQFKSCVAKLIGAGGFKQNAVDNVKAPAAGTTRATLIAARSRTVPPRTTADITAILDQEKPDPARLRTFRDAADAAEPARSDPVSLAHFFFGRAVARSELGRFREAIGDGERALALATGKVDQIVLSNFRVVVASQYESSGDPLSALKAFVKVADDGEHSNLSGQGFLFVAYSNISRISVTLGDFERAQSYLQKLETLWKSRRSIGGFQAHGRNWEASIEAAKAKLAGARGQLDDALRSMQHTEELMRANIQQSSTAMIAIPRSRLEQLADVALLTAAKVKSRQGRIAEAESDARRALLNRLQATGKYNPATAGFIASLGTLLIEQGRYDEAKRLIAAAVEIYRELGVAEDSQTFVDALKSLASVQALEGRWTEADQSHAAIELAVKGWEVARREDAVLSHGHIETLYKIQKIDRGLAAARRLLEIKTTRLGEQHPDAALARGHYAVGLARVRRDAEALKEFQAAVPHLTSATFNTDNDDIVNAASRTRYTQVVVETYIEMLGRTRHKAGIEVVGETFRLADAIRSRAVQKALTASSARMSVSDPALAAAIRQEQDLRQETGAQLGQLNTLLALPGAERDEAGVSELRRHIEKLRADHTRLRADIDRRFPDYADLIDPKPPTLDHIKDALRPSEALLSFYFGREASFAWVIAKDGAADFVVLGDTAAAIEAKITKLREALEPQAASLIPPFDVALSHELYKILLEPMKPGWQSAKDLIVVTNGALGLLPLGVLATTPHAVSNDLPAFFGYRAVQWLARTHTVTMVPSASALRSLRRLSPGSDKRETLVAFGDPYFNEQQASEAGKTAFQVAEGEATRGIPLKRRSSPQTRGADSADLAQLPRLPDTADELRSIALALAVDPSKALHLGKEANEQKVKRMKLAAYKIVAFATHGLMPGEIDGLTQPALALSSPIVAGVEGDGLLTMEEILSLKLDADWVVLSACNTAAAAAAGAEAASGLGRAFFYAGTRAVLVTNWSVYSEPARELVSDLFRRQASNPGLTRGEALRQAMMVLLDGPGVADSSGRILYTYGHPVFWAPYSLIGDGGGS
jgi:CHAT domain-containing protein